MKFKRITSFVLLFVMLFILLATTISASENNTTTELNVKSAILMDAKTKTVLFEQNAHESLPPASVTKIMTLLLVFEEIEKGTLKYEDILSVSENASSMGGSQVFLEPGEQMSVHELLKCVIIASANDAAVTLAEHVAGSEEIFVDRMNKRASELGMNQTHFENVTGLDDDTRSHLISAYDIALMSSELLKHKDVKKYTTIWMDTIRGGEFGLTNTNRLIKYYKGITGLKTGSTSKAGFCVSASAERDGMELIAVIMGAESSSIRNQCASKLLDYGFARFSLYNEQEKFIKEIDVYGGKQDKAKIVSKGATFLIKKEDKNRIIQEIRLPENINAPVSKNQIIGKIIYKLENEVIYEADIVCQNEVEKINFFEFFLKILKNIF